MSQVPEGFCWPNGKHLGVLVARLRSQRRANTDSGWEYINPDGPEAADEIERLSAAIASEREDAASHLRYLAECCKSAEGIGCSSERAEAFEYAADAIERGDHLTHTEKAK
jgi:hypothetical protein